MQFSEFFFITEAAAFKVERLPLKGRGLIATRLIRGPHDDKPGETIIKAKCFKIDPADWCLIQGTELQRSFGLAWDKDHAIALGRGNDSFLFQFSDPKEWDRVKQTTLVKSRGQRFANGLMLSGWNFINHSEKPNVREERGSYSIEVIATRDIPIGEEITKRYNKEGRDAISKIVR